MMIAWSIFTNPMTRLLVEEARHKWRDSVVEFQLLVVLDEVLWPNAMSGGWLCSPG